MAQDWLLPVIEGVRNFVFDWKSAYYSIAACDRSIVEWRLRVGTRLSYVDLE